MCDDTIEYYKTNDNDNNNRAKCDNIYNSINIKTQQQQHYAFKPRNRHHITTTLEPNVITTGATTIHNAKNKG